jgi:hypothetical protein
VDAGFKVGIDKLPVPYPNVSFPSWGVGTTKQPVFFECRNNEVFFVDKDYLDDQVTKLLSSLTPGGRRGKLENFLNGVTEREITNEYYKVNGSYLLAAIVAVDPLPGVHGESSQEIRNPESKFQKVLASVDPKERYPVFLIRDDSFAVFRVARSLAAQKYFHIGWDLLAPGEPLKFGAGSTHR